MAARIRNPYWGSSPSSSLSQPIQFANGTAIAASSSPSPSQGPGATMPAGLWPGRNGKGGGGQGYQQSQQAQLAANEASGQPVEVSAGVWVYPNGQPVTGVQLQALNSASTVLPTSMDAESNTVLAEEQAAAAGTSSTTAATASTATTTAPATSWLDENTITSSYTNGQVVMAAGVAFLAFYLLKRR